MYYKKFDKPQNIGNRNFQKILNFYLFHCPSPNKSVRSKTFAQLGWKGSSQFSKLKKELLEAASKSLKSNYYPCKKEDLETNFELVSNVAPADEYCVFLMNAEKTVIESLFSSIRNAFAHGSFSVQTYNKQRIYFFVNHHRYLKAELVLQEKTLLAWITILENGHSFN